MGCCEDDTKKRGQSIYPVPGRCDPPEGGDWTREMVVPRLEGGRPRRHAEETRMLLETQLAYFLGHGGIDG